MSVSKYIGTKLPRLFTENKVQKKYTPYVMCIFRYSVLDPYKLIVFSL